MAQFRRNHGRGKSPFVGLTVRVFAMLGLCSVLFIAFWRLMGDDVSDSYGRDEAIESVSTSYNNPSVSHEPLVTENAPYRNLQKVDHTYYSLGYAEDVEQAAWVSYKLTKESLQIPNVERSDRFEIDPFVATGSADYYDYRGSGYSRGHLAPAGDMAFSREAMEESFFMSNMSPQKIPFNGGIWRELEETVRDWAYKNEEVYIVTGPVLNDVDKFIGRGTKVGVPEDFYKVLIDIKGNEKKGIGFIMPNEKSDRPIMDYAVTIDKVEEVTGLEFFTNLVDDSLENKLEANIDISKWPVSQKRYENRVTHWNNR